LPGFWVIENRPKLFRIAGAMFCVTAEYGVFLTQNSADWIVC